MKRLLLLFIVPFSSPTHAQAPRLDAAVRAYVSPFADAGDFSGVALVMHGDTVLGQVAAGEAEPGRPVTLNTRFRIASVTKPFTAAAVLRLITQGLISLTSSVCEQLQPCPEAWRPITIRHLLSHTAGIPNYTSFPDFAATQAQATTPDALVARFSEMPLEFAPGTQYAYSNSGYAVLGRVIESVTGQAYADALRSLVLAPLGIVGVHYGDEAGDALGYRPIIGGREPADALDMSVPYAAGALVASASEVAAFARGYFRSSSFLPDSIRMLALTPVQGSYGLGWMTASLGPGRSASHTGSIHGFVAFLAYRPDVDVTVVVLANVERAPAQRMALDLVRMADGVAVAPPTIRRAVPLPEADLDAVVGTYRLDSASDFVVRRAAGGGLEVQATGQRPVPIFAERRDAFFARAVNAQFTFERDGTGRVIRMVLYQGGRAMTAERL